MPNTPPNGPLTPARSPRLVAELAALNETCDRIAHAGIREIDASQLGY